MSKATLPSERDYIQWMQSIKEILQSPGYGFSEIEAARLMETCGMTILQPAWIRGDSPEEAARRIIE